MQIDYPLRFGANGRTALADDADHVRDMIELLLFTRPGERVNRPDFGSGLMHAVFAPNSQELATALEFTIRAALQRYLGDLIEVQGLAVQADDSTLRVTVRYALRSSGERREQTFERPAAAGAAP
jgi:phage baseplate assembly protein W